MGAPSYGNSSPLFKELRRAQLFQPILLTPPPSHGSMADQCSLSQGNGLQHKILWTGKIPIFHGFEQTNDACDDIGTVYSYGFVSGSKCFLEEDKSVFRCPIPWAKHSLKQIKGHKHESPTIMG